MKYSRTCKQLYHWLRGQSVRSLTGAKKKNLDRIFSREWNGMKTRRMKERKVKRILLDIRVYIYIYTLSREWGGMANGGGGTIVVGRDREKESLARNGRLHRVAYTVDMKRERFMGPQELCGT